VSTLSVNLNKVALLRNARTVGVPSVVDAARTCVEAGALGITVHPRPDERHIRTQDVFDLADMLDVEFNIEGNPFPDFMDIVRQVLPAQCTLVPDSPGQFTSDHGWEVETNADRLAPVIREMNELGVRVALFMDVDSTEFETVSQLGADRVELYTEPYAAAFAAGDQAVALEQAKRAVERAKAAGLGVNAGHDLNLDNLPGLCCDSDIDECSIGHALISDALWLGLAETVKRYVVACRRT
jgi:pyridoxine 5-phosphate synthase